MAKLDVLSSVPPLISDSISYHMTKTRFLGREAGASTALTDPLLRNLVRVASCERTTAKEQNDFVEAVVWFEYQDAVTADRLDEFGKIKRLDHC